MKITRAAMRSVVFVAVLLGTLGFAGRARAQTANLMCYNGTKWSPCSATNPLPTTTGGGSTITYTTSTAASVATTSGTLFAAGAYPHTVTFCTLPNSTANVWMNLLGGTAIVGQGTPVFSGGGCTPLGGLSTLPMPGGAVTAITDGASAQTLAVSGG
jgi:hypothetical protein